ncbi:5-(carboxyamino)imidazole ribonucleotide mutase [Cyclobacterium lianum]|uniref:N5-carboxyaminoimidazole ribonucleotide mutase n=1 Tax=Cyclobacterium lianum TaxID=388280 RepID=A0A1M7I6N5_9BACT|nr:5-(carboxyamino)imidazole ribonucleotide mutase [Cyclobacterium lianum]SHM36345.1 5-(carboxyamino)imidazole ribonucleotide mutase [Cyclobacterium lianum]
MSDIKVGIIMGSQSDLPVMAEAAKFLEEIEVGYELTIVSAHRTPDRMIDYAVKARERGIKVIIAGAGGAAHLPGMVASLTSLPVIGVPVKSSNSIDGWDSILSILQMPSGIPVATVALNGAKNAGILAASIVGAFEEAVGNRMEAFKRSLKAKVEASAKEVEQKGWRKILGE